MHMHPISSPLQIGKILSSRRKALGVSQAAMAAKLGISQQRVSDLETQPGELTVARLAIWLSILDLEMYIDKRPDMIRDAAKVEW